MMKCEKVKRGGEKGKGGGGRGGREGRRKKKRMKGKKKNRWRGLKSFGRRKENDG